MNQAFKKFAAAIFSLVLTCTFSFAQSRGQVTIVLSDSSNDEAVGFATVSLTRVGEEKPYKYALSDSKGKAVIDRVQRGKYVLKAELLGYKNFTKEIEVSGNLDLGTVKMDLDKEMLDAASVSAIGNPILVKKDTIEYNASSYRTTENDMLEDLLKKLPGVEVSEDGSVTANGERITKITIDGKTFFLDDPQLATKNLPAKMVEKVKVVKKKSEQAEFTGIDDGNEETVIDLVVNRDMMNGIFGNVSGGVGHDLPEAPLKFSDGDLRYQSGGFIGRFSDKSQISLIMNGNNTNNRGFNDISGGMMRGMMGGGGMGRGGRGGRGGGFGGGSGITRSWMGGLNGALDLFDDDMQLGGNYVYNTSNSTVEEQSVRENYLEDGSVLTYNNGLTKPGFNISGSDGHRFGMRLEHKFSENTSILFQPQVNFGTGDYRQFSDFNTYRRQGSDSHMTNNGFNSNFGSNKNWQTNGSLLFRQRLGLPGRTVSLMTNYSLGNNNLDGYNQSLTETFGKDGVSTGKDIVNQRFDQLSRNSSFSSRLVYTEPLGAGFYAEANYSYSWSQNRSEKTTYNSGSNDGFGMENQPYVRAGETPDATYSNSILNRYQTHQAGTNLQFQNENLRAQIGVSVIPTITHNETDGKTYDSKVVNWAPSAMLRYEMNDNSNIRVTYNGRSSQPSTSQLMPVPDNSNPLNISLGNPYLHPYFNHNLRTEFRMTNRQTFFTINAEVGGGFVQDPIVSSIWYDSKSAQYSLPVNGPASKNGNARLTISAPFGQSNFSISSTTNSNFSQASSYVGKSAFDMSSYDSDGDGIFDDYDSFHQDYPDLGQSNLFSENKTRNLSFNERLRLTYRNDFVNIELGGSTRMSKSWYTLASSTNLTTWTNQINGEMTWTLPSNLEFQASANYNWYRGYTTPQEAEIILNAELNKGLFKNQFTLSLRAYDILNQAKNLLVTDASNYHQEVRNNTLGRYVIVSLTYRFGTFSGRGGRGGFRGPGRGPGGPGGRGGPGGGGPPMGPPPGF